MSIRAARPGPSPGPPWPDHLRAVHGPALSLSGPCRVSPRAGVTAQARAHGPISMPGRPKSLLAGAPPVPPAARWPSRCRRIHRLRVLAGAAVPAAPAATRAGRAYCNALARRPCLPRPLAAAHLSSEGAERPTGAGGGGEEGEQRRRWISGARSRRRRPRGRVPAAALVVEVGEAETSGGGGCAVC